MTEELTKIGVTCRKCCEDNFYVSSSSTASSTHRLGIEIGSSLVFHSAGKVPHARVRPEDVSWPKSIRAHQLAKEGSERCFLALKHNVT